MKRIVAILIAITLIATTFCVPFGVVSAADNSLNYTAPQTFELYDYFEDLENCRVAETGIVSDSPWKFQAKPEGGVWSDWINFSTHGTDQYTYWLNIENAWGNYPGVGYYYPSDRSGRFYCSLIAPSNRTDSADWKIDSAYTFVAPVNGTYQIGKTDQNKSLSSNLTDYFSHYSSSDKLDFGVRITLNETKIIWNGDESTEKRDDFAVFGTKEALTQKIEIPTISSIQLKAGDVIRVEFTSFTPISDSPWAQRVTGTPAITLTAKSETLLTYEIYDYYEDLENCRAAETGVVSDSPWKFQAKPEGGVWSDWIDTASHGTDQYTYWSNSNKAWGSYPGVGYYYPTDRTGRYRLSLITPMNRTDSSNWKIDSAYTFVAPVSGTYQIGKTDQSDVVSYTVSNYFSQYQSVEELDFGVRITINGNRILWNGDSTAEKRDGFAVFGTNTAINEKIEVPTISNIQLNEGDIVRIEFTAFDGLSDSPWRQRLTGTPAISLTAVSDALATYELYDFFDEAEYCRETGSSIITNSPWKFQAKPQGGVWSDWINTSTHGTDQYTYWMNSEKSWGNYPGVGYHYPADRSGRYYLNVITPMNKANSSDWNIDAAYCFVAPVSGTYEIGKTIQSKVASYECANYFSQHNKDELLDFGVRITLNDNRPIWNGDSSAEKRDGFAVFGTNTAINEKIEIPSISGIKLNAGDVLRFEFTAFDGAETNPWAQRINGTPSVRLTAVSDKLASYELYDYFFDIEEARLDNKNFNSDSVWSVQAKSSESDWTNRGDTTSRDSGYTYVYNSKKAWGNYPGFGYYMPDNYVSGERLYLSVITPCNKANDTSYKIDMAYAFTAPKDGVYKIRPADQDMVYSWGAANYFKQSSSSQTGDFGVRITKNSQIIWNGDENAQKQDGFAVFGTNNATVSQIDVPTISEIRLQAGDVLRVEFTAFTPISEFPWSQRIGGMVGVDFLRPITTGVFDDSDDSSVVMDCEDVNLVAGVTPKINCVVGDNKLDTAKTSNPSAMTDGSADTITTSVFDLSGGEEMYFSNRYQTFTFNIGSLANIDKIQVLSNVDKGSYLSEYSIYISDTEYDLYNEENRCYEYNSDELGGAKRNQSILLRDQTSGRYIGLKINKTENGLPSVAEFVVNGYVLGDCDNDKTVSASDLVTIRKGILDLVTLKKSADVTADGKLNIKDLIRLKKTILEAQNKELSNEITIIADDPLSVSDQVFHEQYRPQVHYSPEFGWGDYRSGLVYYEGEYHMFYPHNASKNTNGATSWGHAVSNDLVHWKELPDAILYGEGNEIWSGSCVVDQNDTTGFFNGSSGLVALFTNADLATGTKYSVGLAYSSDKGRTWTKVANPVLTPDENSNFQNLKVFRHEETQKWICVIAGGPMRIYSSTNLKDWTFESKNDLLWAQNPDLYKMPVEGINESKWVFSSGDTTYVVGDFDGKSFTPTQDTVIYDKSPDRNGAMTFNNMPDGRRVEINWMGNWDYSSKLADVLPANGVATVPVELKLVKDGDQYKMERNFVEELDFLRGDKIFEAHSGVLKENSQNPFHGINASTLDLNVRFCPSANAVVNYKFNMGANGEVKVSYDTNAQTLSIDRTKLPLDISEMKKVYTAKVAPDEEGFIELRILLDWSGIEVVANNGESLLSALYFPNKEDLGIEMTVTGGVCAIDFMEAYRMNSVRKSLKVLSIGNSFSVDAQEYLYQIADDLGYDEISLGNLYIGGCSLATHLDNAINDKPAYVYYTNTSGTWDVTYDYKMSDAVKSQDWDYITLQQASGFSGIPEIYSDLSPLMNIVKGMSGDAKFVWHMTWAYQGDHNGLGNYNYKSQDDMFAKIISSVKDKITTRDDFHAIIPNGTAIQNARTSYLGDTLTRDGYHLSLDAGRYIAALNFFHTLTGESIDNISYAPDGVNAKKKAACIESVNNSHKSPFAVTDSTYKTIDMLFIGNSMTYVNDVPGTLAMLAAKNGIIINQKQVVVGGRSLIEHVNDGTALNEIRSGKYDNVCVQEQQAIIDSQSAREDCLKALDILSEETYKANADFHVYLRASKEVEHYGISPLEQSKTMDEFLTPAAQSRNATCIYANRAITIANQTLDFNLWYDGLHHTTHGSYLVVCTFYATYFNRSATELDTAYDLPVEDAKKLQKIADQVVFEGKIPW